MSESRTVIEVVSKPWGFEKRIVNTDKYCGKLLYIVKGKNTSMHYHKIKDETFYVHSGKIKVLYSEDISGDFLRGGMGPYSSMKTVTLNPGDNFRLPPETVHRIIALEDTELYEFSTPHDDNDTVRFEGV